MASLAPSEVLSKEVQHCVGQVDALTAEIRKAIHAIETNALPALEQSVYRQSEMAAGLGVTMACLHDAGTEARNTHSLEDMSSLLRQRMQVLSGLNEEYAVLLQHSGHSVRLLRALHGRDAQDSFGQRAEHGSPKQPMSSWEG